MYQNTHHDKLHICMNYHATPESCSLRPLQIRLHVFSASEDEKGVLQAEGQWIASTRLYASQLQLRNESRLRAIILCSSYFTT